MTAWPALSGAAPQRGQKSRRVESEPNDGRRLAARRGRIREPSPLGNKRLNDGVAPPGEESRRRGRSRATRFGCLGRRRPRRNQLGQGCKKSCDPQKPEIKAPPPAPTPMPRRLEEKPSRRLKGGLEGFSFDFSTRAQQLGQEAASTRPQCVPIIFPIRPNEGSIPPRPSEGSTRSEHPGWGAPQAPAQPRRASPRRQGRTDWAKRASRVVMKKRHKTP